MFIRFMQKLELALEEAHGLEHSNPQESAITIVIVVD